MRDSYGLYNRRTLRDFCTGVFTAVILFILIAANIHYGLTDLIGLTEMAKDAIRCCKTLFSWCLVSPSMFKTVIPWVGLGIIGVGSIKGIFKAGHAMLVAKRFSGNLRHVPVDSFPGLRDLARKDGVQIIPFEDEVIRSAFTIGLVKPAIYISTGLIEELTPEELRAVVLHEIHHAVNKDPLRLFILSFITDMFFFLPIGHYLTSSFYIHKELAADERSTFVTGRPFELATALIKMMKITRAPLPSGVPFIDIDKAGLVEKRVKALLEPEHDRKGIPGSILGFTVTGAVLLIIALALPIYAGTHEMEKCNHDYCLSTERACPSDTTHCKQVCEEMCKE